MSKQNYCKQFITILPNSWMEIMGYGYSMELNINLRRFKCTLNDDYIGYDCIHSANHEPLSESNGVKWYKEGKNGDSMME